MMMQKGKLFQLAETHRSHRKSRGKTGGHCEKQNGSNKISGKHYDEQKAISLAYSLDMYPEVRTPYAGSQNSTSESLSLTDKSIAFYVEPFNAGETIEVQYEGVDSEEKLEKVVRPVMDEHVPAANGGELPSGNAETLLDKVVRPQPESVTSPDPVSGESGQDEIKAELPTEQPPQADPAMGHPDSYDISNEEFAKDIGAILKGQKVYDAEKKKTVASNESKQLPAGREPVQTKEVQDKDEVPDLSKNEHKIFEKIAQSMQYANSYDLGSIALEKKFEKMEQEIEREEIDKVLSPPSSPSQQSDVKGDDTVAKEESPIPDIKPMKKPTSDILDESSPLDPKNGGRYVTIDQLTAGDLVLVAQSAARLPSQFSGSVESISGLYSGNGKLLAVDDSGVLRETDIAPGMGLTNTMVALRHAGIAGQGTAVVAAVKALLLKPIGQVEKWLKIQCSNISIHPDVCEGRGVNKTKCQDFSGRIQLGTAHNDHFYCPQQILSAFEAQGLSFAKATIPAMPGTVGNGEHNGDLKYYGHLS